MSIQITIHWGTTIGRIAIDFILYSLRVSDGIKKSVLVTTQHWLYKSPNIYVRGDSLTEAVPDVVKIVTRKCPGTLRIKSCGGGLRSS